MSTQPTQVKLSKRDVHIPQIEERQSPEQHEVIEERLGSAEQRENGLHPEHMPETEQRENGLHPEHMPVTESQEGREPHPGTEEKQARQL